MAYRTQWPYDEITPDEYRDRPIWTPPGQATPPKISTARTPAEHATAARYARELENEYRAKAADLRAKGDGHRVRALAAESSAAMYARMALAHETAP